MGQASPVTGRRQNLRLAGNRPWIVAGPSSGPGTVAADSAFAADAAAGAVSARSPALVSIFPPV